MKATNNTDTLFMDIFVELFAIAKVYFEELFKNADPGTYTIKDIYAFIEKNIEATKQGKTVSPIQSEKESSLNDKERGETKQIERDNSIQPKGTKPTVQYTDDMLELVSLDLNSMTYVVNGDIGTAKNIQSIVLYDEIGKNRCFL